MGGLSFFFLFFFFFLFSFLTNDALRTLSPPPPPPCVTHPRTTHPPPPRLLVRYAREHCRLFDLDADPAERVNLAASEPGRVATMLARLAVLADESVEPMQWDPPYQGPDYFCAACPKHPPNKAGPAAPWLPWL